MTGFSNIGKASGFAGVGTDGLPEGDLTGSYPNPTVVGIQLQPVDPRIPDNGDLLVYNGGEWIPTPAPTSTTFFQGTWDANANSPDIDNFPGLSDGYTWIVSVAGNTNLGGITDWIVGDYAVYSNGNWYKLSNSSFGWLLTGNNGTNPNINYVGTADEHDLSLRANNSEVLRLYWTGGSRLSGSVLMSDTLTVTSNITGSNAKLLGDLEVCGGDITTKSVVFNLLNGATTRINMGNSAAHNLISGSTKFPQGLSGSLTHLVDGTSAFIPHTGIIITSSSNGPVVFKVDDSKFAALTGSVFSGPVVFNSGLSGSLTKLADGTSYIVANSNTTVVTQSNGSVKVSSIPSGLDTQVQFNDGGFFAGDSGLTYNKTTDELTVAGDINVNGGDIKSTASTFNLLNGGTTTVNFATGASSALNIGNSAGTNTVSGTSKFPQGLSGSLTKLTDGSSYLIAGNNTTIVTGSSGAVTITSIPSGNNTELQFNSGGSFAGTPHLTWDGNNLIITGSILSTGQMNSATGIFGDLFLPPANIQVISVDATTVTPTTSYHRINATANVTITNTPSINFSNAVLGSVLFIQVILGSVGSVTFNKGAAQRLSLGANTRKLSAGGSLQLIYDGTYWIEMFFNTATSI